MKNVILLISICFLCSNIFAQNEVDYPIFDELFKNVEDFSGNILDEFKKLDPTLASDFEMFASVFSAEISSSLFI